MKLFTKDLKLNEIIYKKGPGSLNMARDRNISVKRLINFESC